MNSKTDAMGRAIAEYNNTHKAGKLRVFSPMFDEDEIPVEWLFRTYGEMPKWEQQALDRAQGRILDVGAASGCHSLVLQEQGKNVVAIDISPLSVEVMVQRGVKHAIEQDFFAVTEQYDTILMLMNGIGIVGTIDQLPDFFEHLKRILAPGGQLLCDSSDISYIFEDEDGFIEYPEDSNYFGELTYRMQYKDTVGEPFPWLYIDAQTLGDAAVKAGFDFEVLAEGDHYEYLARITRVV
ncbi:class I SAM-dependent methyltransferase [Segatella bryantii]|uniref:class I SAM-dependent methyltransferase n=1 Tax=Segatella bryantii TaxID=77095 RepID=UPI00243093FE|nr:class I SAM-dependent methyltransferase [Segatella bryantii]